MKRKSNFLLIFALAIVLGIFCFATGRLLQIYQEYRKGEKTYEDLQDYVKDLEQPELPDDKNINETEDSDSEPNNAYLQVDFDGLWTVNPEVIAWIDIPALEISYPVVQGNDNFYYLSHLFTGEYNNNGSIFADYHNRVDFTDKNTIIYGHNMKNGSMFGTLDKYSDQTLYEQAPYFYIYVPEGIYQYHILSCYAGKTGSEGYTYRFGDEADFLEFLETIQSYAGYKTDVEVTPDDRVVTLSTCVNTNRDYRYLVHGKLIKKLYLDGTEMKMEEK